MAIGLSQTTTAGVHGTSNSNAICIVIGYKFSPRKYTSLRTAMIAISFEDNMCITGGGLDVSGRVDVLLRNCPPVRTEIAVQVTFYF